MKAILVFFLFVNFQTICLGLYTKVINPSEQWTIASTELIKHHDEGFFFNRGFCSLNEDSLNECSLMVRCDQSKKVRIGRLLKNQLLVYKPQQLNSLKNNNPDYRKEVVTYNFLPVFSPQHVWYVVESSGWSPGAYYQRIKLDSTLIIINNQSFQQLLTSSDSTGNNWQGSKKYAREGEGKLWVIDSTTTAEEVCIMDMNLKKGDEFSYADGVFGKTRELLVSDVDSIMDMSGQIRKVIHLSCDFDLAVRYRWIEGVGPDVGVFSSTFNHCVIDGNESSLTCFYSDGVQMWQSEDFEQCWFKPSSTDTTDMDRSTIWYSSSYIGSWSDGDCRKKIDITKVVRDTLIEDRLCRIIGVTSGGQYFPESEIIEYSKDGKMYFYEDDEWRLLYDFTAQIGDTVTYYISKTYPYYFKFGVPIPFNQGLVDDNPYQLVIKNIDTIYDNSGKPLKRFFTERIFNVHGHFMREIIENIGSKEKLFGNNSFIIPPQCSPFEESVGLRCYSNDDISIKFTEGECEKLTRTTEILDFTVKLYPNPGNDWVNVNLGSGVVFPVSYQMTDIAGRIIGTDIQNIENFSVNFRDLTPDLYIISIRDKVGKVWHGKWVKE